MEKYCLLKFSNREYKVKINLLSRVSEEFIKHLPLKSVVNNIGGEIYFRVPGVEIEYDGSQSEEFGIGDIVYWRSPNGAKIFSVAMFYGNTRYSNWKTSRASSPCVKIGEIENIEGMEAIESGESINFVLQ